MAKVYISYMHNDREIAQNISAGLRGLGHEVSLDVDSLHLGQDWRKTLSDALKGAEVFVSLLSQASIQSAFVLTELGTARGFSQANGSLLIIPVILDNMQVPPAIQDIQALYATSLNVDEIVRNIDDAVTAFSGRKAAEEKQQSEVKERIEVNSAIYIDETLKSLEMQEARDRSEGNYWYYLGYITHVTQASICEKMS